MLIWEFRTVPRAQQVLYMVVALSPHPVLNADLTMRMNSFNPGKGPQYFCLAWEETETDPRLSPLK